MLWMTLVVPSMLVLRKKRPVGCVDRSALLRQEERQALVLSELLLIPSSYSSFAKILILTRFLVEPEAPWYFTRIHQNKKRGIK